MGRRATEPLEKKDIILFKGDWDRLDAILRPRKVKVTVFIRALIRKKLAEIDARAGLQAQPTTVELTDDDLGNLADLSAGTGEPGESDGTV